MSQPLVVVRVLDGPHRGARFATPLHGLTEGISVRYLDGRYTFVRDPDTGRWAAVHSPPTGPTAGRPAGAASRPTDHSGPAALRQ